MYHPPALLQIMFFYICNYIYCCFLCLVIETEVFLFIRRFQELSGILHNFHNDILGDLLLLLSKLACGHPFDLLTNMYWSLCTDRQGLPETFLISFSIKLFMLLFNLKYLQVHLSHNTFKTLIIYQSE